MNVTPTFQGTHFFERNQLNRLPKLQTLLGEIQFSTTQPSNVPDQVWEANAHSSINGGTMDNIRVVEFTDVTNNTIETPFDRFVTEQTQQIAQEAGVPVDSFYRYVAKRMPMDYVDFDDNGNFGPVQPSLQQVAQFQIPAISDVEFADVVKQLPLRPQGSGWTKGGKVGSILYAKVQQILAKTIPGFEISPLASK